jgi:hypothetical protein
VLIASSSRRVLTASFPVAFASTAWLHLASSASLRCSTCPDPWLDRDAHGRVGQHVLSQPGVSKKWRSHVVWHCESPFTEVNHRCLLRIQYARNLYVSVQSYATMRIFSWTPSPGWGRKTCTFDVGRISTQGQWVGMFFIRRRRHPYQYITATSFPCRKTPDPACHAKCLSK